MDFLDLKTTVGLYNFVYYRVSTLLKRVNFYENFRCESGIRNAVW
jgi:hypothetical protein